MISFSSLYYYLIPQKYSLKHSLISKKNQLKTFILLSIIAGNILCHNHRQFLFFCAFYHRRVKRDNALREGDHIVGWYICLISEFNVFFSKWFSWIYSAVLFAMDSEVDVRIASIEHCGFVFIESIFEIFFGIMYECFGIILCTHQHHLNAIPWLLLKAYLVSVLIFIFSEWVFCAFINLHL